MAQEALSNIARHAQARRVWLTLSHRDEVVVLDVRDRDRITVSPGMDEGVVRAAALASPRVQAALAGRTPRRVIVVLDRVVTIVP